MDAANALTGSCDVDSSGYKPIVDAVDVVDDEAHPGPETRCVSLPVRNRSIQPDLTVANDELHVADDPGCASELERGIDVGATSQVLLRGPDRPGAR